MSVMSFSLQLYYSPPEKSGRSRIGSSEFSSIKKTYASAYLSPLSIDGTFVSTPVISTIEKKKKSYTLTRLAHEALDKLKSDQPNDVAAARAALNGYLSNQRDTFYYQQLHDELQAPLLELAKKLRWAEVVSFTTAGRLSELRLMREKRWWEIVIAAIETAESHQHYEIVFNSVMVLITNTPNQPAETQRYSRHLNQEKQLAYLLANKTAEELNQLKQEAHTLKLDCEKRWLTILEKIFQVIIAEQKTYENEGRAISKKEVEANICDVIETASRNYYYDTKKNTSALLKTYSDEALLTLAGDLKKYLLLRADNMRLAEQLTEKSVEVLEKLQKEVLASEEKEFNKNNSIRCVSPKERVEKMIEYQCDFYRNEHLSAQSNIDSVKAEEAANAMDDFLKNHKKREELTDALTKMSVTELEKHVASATIETDALRDENCVLQERMALYETTVQETTKAIKDQCALEKDKGHTPFARSLADQPLDILSIIAEKSMLDKAIEAQDIEIIDKILMLAKPHEKEILLRESLQKLIGHDDFHGILTLAAHGCLFDRELMKRVCYEPKARGLFAKFSVRNSEKISSQLFSDFFDEHHHFTFNKNLLDLLISKDKVGEDFFALIVKNANSSQWKDINQAIEKRYLPSGNNASESIKLPTLVLARLKKEHQEVKDNEAICKTFVEAIVHTVTARKKSRYGDFYDNKTTQLLRSLYRAEGETLLQKEKSIAAHNAQEKSVAGERRSIGYVTPLSPTTTRQIFIRKQKELDQLVDEAPLDVSVVPGPDGSASVSQVELKKMIVQTTGDSNQREMRFRREAIARAMFKETLDYLDKHKDKYEGKHKQKRELLEKFIQEYIDGVTTADEFTQKIEQQLDQRTQVSAAVNDAALILLGTPISMYGCCGRANFGQNKTAQLIRKVLTPINQRLLEKYSSLRV